MGFRVVTETFAQQNLHSPLVPGLPVLGCIFQLPLRLDVAMWLSSSQWNVSRSNVSQDQAQLIKPSYVYSSMFFPLQPFECQQVTKYKVFLHFLVQNHHHHSSYYYNIHFVPVPDLRAICALTHFTLTILWDRYIENIVILFSLFRRGNWSAGMLSNFPKVTQQTSGKVGWACCSPGSSVCARHYSLLDITLILYRLVTCVSCFVITLS